MNLFRVADGPSAWRWAFLAVLTATALWLGVLELPAQAAWINGGVLFAAYLCLCAWLLVAAGAWARGSLRGLSWPVLLLSPLVAWLFYLGAQASADSLVNFKAIPYFAAGTLLWAVLGARESRPLAGEPPAPWLWACGLLLVGLGLGLGLAWLRQWASGHLRWLSDVTSLGLLLPSRDGISNNDILGGPFRQAGWLWVVALWAGLLAAAVAWRGRLGEKRLLAALFGLALLGKIAMAGLSSQGLGIIATKIESINTHYYAYAATIHDPLTFLRGFNALQATAGAHVDVHPPLAVLIYWLLRVLFFAKPLPVALGIMALSAAAVLPLYRLGRGLGGPDGGLAAAALFVTSPLSLILGNAGIDSIVFTLVALSAWCLWEAARGGGWKWSAAAGAWLGLAALNSFGALGALAFLGTWGLLLLWRRGGGWAVFAARNLELWGVFSAGLLVAVFGLGALSMGHFNYLQAMGSAKFTHMSMNHFRAYALWSWGNVVIYAAYTGMGLVALWVLRVGGSLFAADTSDPLTLASAAAVISMILQAFGRGEVQREYLFGAVFLLPVAAAALPRGRDGRLQSPALSLALGLNIATAVVLQICVLDYW